VYAFHAKEMFTSRKKKELISEEFPHAYVALVFLLIETSSLSFN
jgi:hypothetical protein